MKKDGVSIIALIITIIVIILLAAIIIYMSSDTVHNANLAKFKHEMADLKVVAMQTAAQKQIQLMNRGDFKDKEIYYMIASGKNVEKTSDVVASGKIEEMEMQIYPDILEGYEYYEITDDTDISKEAHRNLNFGNETQVKYYITDVGETFILPGFPEYDDGKAIRYWINENKYYIGEQLIPVGPEVPTESGESGNTTEPAESGESGNTTKPPESMGDITDEELEDFKDQYEEETGNSANGFGFIEFLKWLFKLLGWM